MTILLQKMLWQKDFSPSSIWGTFISLCCIKKNALMNSILTRILKESLCKSLSLVHEFMREKRILCCLLSILLRRAPVETYCISGYTLGTDVNSTSIPRGFNVISLKWHGNNVDSTSVCQVGSHLPASVVPLQSVTVRLCSQNVLIILYLPGERDCEII